MAIGRRFDRLVPRSSQKTQEGAIRRSRAAVGAGKTPCSPYTSDMELLGQRLEALRQVSEDPPFVHAGAPEGVWRSEETCYRFLAERCPPGTRTLETGLGVSTVLFAAWGARHTCVVGWQAEIDLCKEYLDSRRIPRENVSFVFGASDDVLPQLRLEPIDLYLIDGGHGFPTPTIDWYYGARWLRRGGVVVVDDLQLPAVGDSLVSFLDRDPRWVSLARTWKWAAYRRESEGLLRDEWTDQSFLRNSRRKRAAAQRVAGMLKRLSPKRD